MREWCETHIDGAGGSYRKGFCPWCDIDRLTAELAEARENAEIHAKRAERFNCAFWAMKGRAEQAEKEAYRYREALKRLRDCDWVISLPNRMDAVRDIAREALKEGCNDVL